MTGHSNYVQKPLLSSVLSLITAIFEDFVVFMLNVYFSVQLCRYDIAIANYMNGSISGDSCPQLPILEQ